VSENDSNETTYQSQFGIEVERREAHLAALPGSVYREWFESLNRASKVFSGNSSELEKHLTKFVGTPTFVSELSDDFGDESARLLHNYLAALATLRDTQRSIHHKLSPEPDDNDPNRTRWEVTVWDPKRKQLYGDDPIAFLVKLRDYSLHYTIPVVTMATSFESTGGPGGPMQFNNTVAVHRPELLKWNRWTTEAKRYIDTHDGDNIELLPLVALYSTRVREFFGWFWKQVEDHSGAEYRCTLGRMVRGCSFARWPRRGESVRSSARAAGASSRWMNMASGWSAGERRNGRHCRKALAEPSRSSSLVARQRPGTADKSA
jgi:hypothetical protein